MLGRWQKYLSCVVQKTVAWKVDQRVLNVSVFLCDRRLSLHCKDKMPKI
jgi:hypothetical protein